MKNAVTDNSINVDEVILWQYDHAPTLIALIRSLTRLATAASTDLWNYILVSVANIDTASTFGLAVWCAILGVKMPDYSKLPSDLQAQLSPEDIYEVLRKILKAKAYLYNVNASVPSYNRYLSLIFGKVEESEDDESSGDDSIPISKCWVLDFGCVADDFDSDSEDGGWDSEASEGDEAYPIWNAMAMGYAVNGIGQWSLAEQLFCPADGVFPEVPNLFADCVREHPAGVGRNTPLAPAPLLDMNKDNKEGQGWNNFALSARQDNGGAFAPESEGDDEESS